MFPLSSMAINCTSLNYIIGKVVMVDDKNQTKEIRLIDALKSIKDMMGQCNPNPIGLINDISF